MAKPAFVEFLRRVQLELRQGRAGRVIPCVHDHLEMDLDVLAAAAARLDGAFFDLSDRGWNGAPGPISTRRRALVQGFLQAAPDDALRDVAFAEDEGLVKVRLDRPLAAEEESLRPIIRLAELLVSSVYDQFDMVMIAVPDMVGDPRRDLTLWQLLTWSPEELTSTGLTVVPIVGAAASLETDFRRQPGVRFFIRDDRVVERNGVLNAASVLSILDGPRKRPVVLFLGAGTSASAGIQLGNHYRDIAIGDLLRGEFEDSHTAAEAFFAYVQERGRFIDGEATDRESFVKSVTLERVLRESFHERGNRPRSDLLAISEMMRHCAGALDRVSQGRAALRKLAAALAGRLVIITVNFDQLVETDLGAATRVMHTPDQFFDAAGYLTSYLNGEVGSGAIPILKLHGSIEDVDSLIANLDETSAGLDSRVHRALRELTDYVGADGVEAPLTWVWVGCSMRDQDVNQFLSGLPAEALEEWWVDPAPGASLDEFVHQHRVSKWRNQPGASARELKDKLIVDLADQFLADLAAEA